MTATETITSNERVLGADPLVVYKEATDDAPEKAGGIGEEDIVSLVIPYIKSAREGVIRLGALLEEYGTYEMNGIAFSDVNEIWWMETIGGHHWIAKRVPDDEYVVMPNQQGIDSFDLKDALGSRKNYMASADIREFIDENHLDLSMGDFNARLAFGSHDDADHVYNTPRAWYMLRYFNPHAAKWDEGETDFSPMSDSLPWSMIPERKITPEDVKYILSSHFQGTPYDPYISHGDKTQAGAFRSIGVNRTDFMGFIQIRPYMPEECRAVEWLAFASNAFNVMVPFYANVETTPDYLANTKEEVSTDNFYWTSRMIAAYADAGYKTCQNHIERYVIAVGAKAHDLLNAHDAEVKAAVDASKSPDEIIKSNQQANEDAAAMVKEQAGKTLSHVLYEVSNAMKNSYARSDA